jgi:GNAT superfamily N-acetyltransferase
VCSDVRIGWESLQNLLDAGLADMVRAHWEEVAVYKAEMPLSVDWDRYRIMEQQGLLKLVGARAASGRLLAYASFVVMPHLHYSETLHAGNDAIYVDPTMRGLGIRFIRETERLLADFAAPNWIRILYRAKFHVAADRGTFSRVYEHLGYVPMETTLDKLVRAPNGN